MDGEERKEAVPLEKTVNVRVRRYDPATDTDSRYDTFEVPVVHGMSVLDALDFIYEHLDGTLSYYDHAACNQGICKRCLIQINGETGLMCQTRVEGDVTLDPLPRFDVVKDLVTARGGETRG